MARVASLDSLRGVAAVTVLLDHYALILPSRLIPPKQPWAGGSWMDPWWWIDYTPLKLLFNGDQAVLLFFALSGFVLALSFESAAGQSYLHFIIKRVVRLYVPFATAILLAAALFASAGPTLIPGLSYYFNYTCWNRPLTTSIVLGHLAMTDLHAFQQLDHVIWSLVVEMRISIVFPFIVYCARARWLTTIIVSVIISGIALTLFHYLRLELLFNPFLALRYLFLFSAGAVLALNIESAGKPFERLSRSTRVMVWLITLATVTYYPANNHFGLFVCGAATVALVFLCYADLRARSLLSSPLTVWLGKVSFSLYLLHVPILLFVIHMLHGVLPLGALIALSTIVAFGLSELGHRFVEQPAILIGRTLANRFARTPTRLTSPISPSRLA